MDLYSSWNLLGPFFFFSKIKPCKTMHENNVNVKIIFWGETWLVSGILQVMSLPAGKSGAGGFEHAWTGSSFGHSTRTMKLWATAQDPFRQACVPYVVRAWRTPLSRSCSFAVYLEPKPIHYGQTGTPTEYVVLFHLVVRKRSTLGQSALSAEQGWIL